MESSDKENVSVNFAEKTSAGKNKWYRRIIVSDDSDSDFEDSGSKDKKKVLPNTIHSDGGNSQPIGKLSGLRKTIKLNVSSDGSDREVDDQIGDCITLSSDPDEDSCADRNATSAGDEKLAKVNPVVLGTDIKKNEEITVHPKIVRKLFPHQVEGIKFMFDSCYNDLNAKRKYRRQDHGCILAHCMGLGKTLQLIALLYTAISYPQLGTNKILIICPKSTILNWKAEIQNWLKVIKDGRKLKVFTFPDSPAIEQKIDILAKWSRLNSEHDDAGVLLLGYDAFRTIVFYKTSNKKTADAELIRGKISEYLLKPGADLVVLDEGHKIKNSNAATSEAVNKIWTKRRIILTGTPMQNNLKEYYSMVNFVKPDFLGSKADFAEDYANPIKKGQHKDSTPWDVRVMKEKSYILHKKLSKFVQRRDVAVLKEFLPTKYEYDIFIRMTDVQNELYDYYLQENPLKDGKKLLPDYHAFRKIWTHPKVLETAYEKAWAAYRRKYNDADKMLKQAKAKKKTFRDEEEEYSDSELDRNGEVLDENGEVKEIRMMSPLHDWWKTRITPEQRDSILSGNKIRILFEILNICERENEKCLVFSEYTSVLDVVEMAMQQVTEHAKSGTDFEGLVNRGSKWQRAWDYCRLDGSVSQSDRQCLINRFNKPNEKRLRVFLISSQAGGQGINLTSATRVVLLDTSWNPSNDQQSIFRVFRLGQKKECYIYRLLAMGTMEEKVYSRSVTKQATSFRVVDKQQIERHYNMVDLEELYTFTKPELTERPVPNIPGDKVLANLLLACPDTVFKYHEHDSLLEKEDDLTEEEKEAVWKQYEQEAKVNEATLQQVMSQETPPFLDSEPKLNETDPFLDEFNGNNLAKISAPDWNIISSLTSGVMAHPPAVLPPKPSNNSVDNVPLSFSLLNDVSSDTANLRSPIAVADQTQPESFIYTVSKADEIASSTFSSHSSIAARVPIPTADFRSNSSNATAEKRKLKSMDIRDLLTMPPKRSKMSLSNSKSNLPVAVGTSGWLTTQAKFNQPSTSNQYVSDEIIELDD